MRLEKKCMILLISAIGISNSIFASSILEKHTSNNIYVNDKLLSAQNKSYMFDNQCLIELRFICDSLGARLEYNNANITIYKNETIVNLKVGSDKVEINGSQYELNKKPIINNGRVYVSIRDICTLLQVDITYDTETKGIYLSTPDKVLINNVADAYFKAICAVRERVPGEYSNLKYVALDITDMKYLSDGAKNQLVKKLEGIAPKVLIKTKSQLEKEGYIVNGVFDNGIVISINDLKSIEKQLILSVELWHSLLDSHGYKEIILEEVEESWQVISCKLWFLS